MLNNLVTRCIHLREKLQGRHNHLGVIMLHHGHYESVGAWSYGWHQRGWGGEIGNDQTPWCWKVDWDLGWGHCNWWYCVHQKDLEEGYSLTDVCLGITVPGLSGEEEWKDLRMILLISANKNSIVSVGLHLNVKMRLSRIYNDSYTDFIINSTNWTRFLIIWFLNIQKS